MKRLSNLGTPSRSVIGHVKCDLMLFSTHVQLLKGRCRMGESLAFQRGFGVCVCVSGKYNEREGEVMVYSRQGTVMKRSLKIRGVG